MSDEELKAIIDKCLDIYEVACWNGIDKKILEETENEQEAN